MNKLPVLLIAWGVLSPAVFGQNQLVGTQPAAPQPETNGNRILWIIPNFRTTGELKNYQPISAAAKFKIARQDTFDRGTVALAGPFAGEAQLDRADRSFGHGVGGYAHYFAASYADFAIGNYMTEGVFPVLIHQDPALFPARPWQQPVRSFSPTAIRATPRSTFLRSAATQPPSPFQWRTNPTTAAFPMA